ncbi:MAG: DJ-1/PfpI family protein [Bacteroidales bacterium]|nr:DJ-1/PfpI family protein [Bacteroidales bacterium]
MQYKLFLLVSIIFLFSCENVNIKKDTAENGVTNNSLVFIAVFDGNGAGTVSVLETIEALRIDTGIIAHAVSASQILNGELANYKALIIPGGSGSKQLNNIGEQGQEIIKEYVANGGGIIGICAGAYMLSSTSGYPNMDIASSVHIDREHYNRGRGLVQFELTEPGLKIFPELENQSLFVQYYDGPVLVQGDTVNTYNELGKFVTDIHPDNFAPKGITPGRTFLLNQVYGKGKVFIMAGHPESTPGMRWLVPRMARWVSNTDMISYADHWVRPQINDSAIIFNREMRKYEKKLFWTLFDENESEKVDAMVSLNELRSRPAVRWNIGLLRSNNDSVRLMAAKLLYDTEYTAAIYDIEQALKNENNEEIRFVLKKFILDYSVKY